MSAQQGAEKESISNGKAHNQGQYDDVCIPVFQEKEDVVDMGAFGSRLHVWFTGTWTS